MKIEKLNLKDCNVFTEFLNNATSVNKPMIHSIEEIIEGITTADNFRIYGITDRNKLISFITLRDIIIQKIQVLDLFFIRNEIDIDADTLNCLIDTGIKDGEGMGIFRVFEARSESYHLKNLSHVWENRYDTYIDEILLPNQFSKFDIVHSYVNRQKIFSEKMIYVHHYLKQATNNDFY
jgi:hypothetical protein